MPRDVRNLEDELPPDIGFDKLLLAVGFTTIASTPVASLVPKAIGEMVFVTGTKQFFIAVGPLNTNWSAMNDAS